MTAEPTPLYCAACDSAHSNHTNVVKVTCPEWHAIHHASSDLWMHSFGQQVCMRKRNHATWHFQCPWLIMGLFVLIRGECKTRLCKQMDAYTPCTSSQQVKREISINTGGSWKVCVQYCKSKSLYACFFTQSMSLFNNQCALRCASLFFIHIVNSNKLKRNKVNYSYNCVRGFYNCPELWIIRSGSQINDFQWLQ